MDKEILEEIVPPDNPAFISVKDLEYQSNDTSTSNQLSEPIDETFLIKSNQVALTKLFDEYEYIWSSEQMIETRKAKEAMKVEDVNEENNISTASNILYAGSIGRGKTILLYALAAMSLKKIDEKIDETLQTTRNIGLPIIDQPQKGAYTQDPFQTTHDIVLQQKDHLKNEEDIDFVQKTQQKDDQNYQMQMTMMRDQIRLFVSIFLSLVLMDQQRASPRKRTCQKRSRQNGQIIKRLCGSSPFFQTKNCLLKMREHLVDLDDDEKEYMMENDDTELRFEQSIQKNIAILL